MDEDAFDISGFRGTCDPDEVRVVRHGGESIGDGAVDFGAAYQGNVMPWGKGGEAVGSRFVADNDGAGFRNRSSSRCESGVDLIDPGAGVVGGDFTEFRTKRGEAGQRGWNVDGTDALAAKPGGAGLQMGEAFCAGGLGSFLEEGERIRLGREPVRLGNIF